MMRLDEGDPEGSADDTGHLFNRELSWLSFNDRVLQEAMDPTVPLLERLRFLAIVSSNLDEFFRVRVASLRTLLRLKKKKLKKLGIHPRKLLRLIHRKVTEQQDTFGQTLRGQVLPNLALEGIHLVDEDSVRPEHEEFLRQFLSDQVRPLLHPVDSESRDPPPFLKDRHSYLVVELWPRSASTDPLAGPAYWLVEVPTDDLPRFVTLPDLETPDDQTRHDVMFLDDVIRFNLGTLFPDSDIVGAYAVKLSRDADLHLEDEFSGDLVEKIRKSLAKRAKGVASRFLYDTQAPPHLVSHFVERLSLAEDDLVPGWRYHNLHDFFSFPTFGRSDLVYEPMEPLDHPELGGARPLFDVILERDRLLHFPYQSFSHVLDFLAEAAHDPLVSEVWISLYRVTKDSAVAQSLIEARKRGKRVTVFVEVQARFDEASNLAWADRMKEAGVHVLFSRPGIKVHSKIALVAREEDSGRRLYAYLATGNFNEKTALIYADLGLFTADPRLTEEVLQVFGLLGNDDPETKFEHLLVAPFQMRDRFEALIGAEMDRARSGEKGGMILKMNSLEDAGMIERICEASEAGVEVDIIVRGICRLKPGMSGERSPIRVRSIVDRFLEHTRVFVFRNGGDERVFVASADWMTRNLNRRVEVAFPVYDRALKRQILAMLDLQLRDNTKARVVDAEQVNEFVKADGPPTRSQLEQYEYLKRLDRM